MNEMALGTNVRLPGDIVDHRKTVTDGDKFSYVNRLKRFFDELQPIATRVTPISNAFVPSSLETAPFVYLRIDANRPALTCTYKGPYKVLKRGRKAFSILINGKPRLTAIDRLKPACIPATEEATNSNSSSSEHHTPLSTDYHDVTELCELPLDDVIATEGDSAANPIQLTKYSKTRA